MHHGKNDYANIVEIVDDQIVAVEPASCRLAELRCGG